MAHSLSALPTEILILILYPLAAHELANLARTSRRMHALVYEFGWLQYLHCNPRPSYSLFAARQKWSHHQTVRYNTLTDRAWERTEYIARPLSRTWPAKEQSTLAISPSRLIVAAGAILYSYSFHSGPGGQPSMKWEGEIPLNQTHVRGRNITSIAFLEDGGNNQVLIVAYQEQLVERIKLIPPSADGEVPLSFSRTPLPAFPKGDYIESFHTSGSQILSLSANGTARLSFQSALDNRIPLSSLEIQERSWKCHLSASFAAFGATGTTPLTIHSLSEDGILSPIPSTILHTSKATPDDLPSSAVYGLSQAPPSSPWGPSPQIIVSGWFDGQVRIYDLRLPSSSSHLSRGQVPLISKDGSTSSVPLLAPVMTLIDRWSNEPIYSVSGGGGGGSASHIAAGTARHSVVSFWDVRNPKAGWSVHAPGNDRSPVFAVVLEGSRVFGVTELRPFIYDFGPNLAAECYPSILPGPRMGREGIQHKAGILNYRTTKYRHSSSGLAGDF